MDRQRGPPSLRARIADAALSRASTHPYGCVSFPRNRWDRGAWARPNGEGRVDERGDASLGLALFGSFWGNAKKNKPHLRLINPSPIPHLPLTTHPSQQPFSLKYPHALITYKTVGWQNHPPQLETVLARFPNTSFSPGANHIPH